MGPPLIFGHPLQSDDRRIGSVTIRFYAGMKISERQRDQSKAPVGTGILVLINKSFLLDFSREKKPFSLHARKNLASDA